MEAIDLAMPFLIETAEDAVAVSDLSARLVAETVVDTPVEMVIKKAFVAFTATDEALDTAIDLAMPLTTAVTDDAVTEAIFLACLTVDTTDEAAMAIGLLMLLATLVVDAEAIEAILLTAFLKVVVVVDAIGTDLLTPALRVVAVVELTGTSLPIRFDRATVEDRDALIDCRNCWNEVPADGLIATTIDVHGTAVEPFPFVRVRTPVAPAVANVPSLIRLIVPVRRAVIVGVLPEITPAPTASQSLSAKIRRAPSVTVVVVAYVVVLPF